LVPGEMVEKVTSIHEHEHHPTPLPSNRVYSVGHATTPAPTTKTPTGSHAAVHRKGDLSREGKRVTVRRAVFGKWQVES
jgi:hypothetical protein